MSDSLTSKVIPRAQIRRLCAAWREQGKRIVFTNGCFDILHAGHVQLLHEARALGDCLVVGINADASVRRLKGETRPVHDQDARAFVLAGLAAVDAVCVFDEDTPVALIEEVRPHWHVKGGDYRPEDLPEAATVRRGGGDIKIVPLRDGFSTTAALQKLQTMETACLLFIPARYGSTRFPGKPLAQLGPHTVIEHVVRAGLQSRVNRPICVATDDERIADVIRHNFAVPEDVEVIMTSSAHRTGTDRIAEAIRAWFGELAQNQRLIVINVQGDEPFINPQHIDALADAMRADANLTMATLATPIQDPAQLDDPNVVKVVVDCNDSALYFSRYAIPYERPDASNATTTKLRHLGVYAYAADWLLRMAALPATPLEEAEKLEQLRALENGVKLKVLTVRDVVNIAIDTPHDLILAEQFLLTHESS